MGGSIAVNSVGCTRRTECACAGACMFVCVHTVATYLISFFSRFRIVSPCSLLQYTLYLCWLEANSA